jgi:membrane peptidoglycan carboxypeptidase
MPSWCDPVKLLSFFARLLAVVVLGAAALAGSVALLGPAARSLAGTTTPLGDLDVTINAPAARTIVYDRFGNPMPGGTFARQDRAPVKLKNVPQVLIDAVISIEDRKFYEHHGVDIGGSVRALFKNVDAGGISQGGSTITQQLVKNTLSVNQKRDMKTKVREAVLATRLEHELTKNQILEDYLNLVYFGNGAYGVQAAAERYFPKTPLAKLNLAQSALLAGLIQAPESLNPIKHPDAAARRRSEVLDAMVTNNKATVAKARAAKSVPLPTHLSYPHSTRLDYYLAEVLRRMSIDDPAVDGDPGEVLGATPSARAKAVYRGGLKVYTAYDPFAQLQADTAIRTVLPPATPFTASLVVIDNHDGGVRAIANGRTFAQMQFDPATEGQGRQAGSAFKTFTLAAALSHGYSPNDNVSGGSISWRLGPGSGPDAVYNLHGDCHGGTPTLTQAIAISDNCAFVRTELSLGPGNYGRDGVDTVTSTAAAMGIDTSKFQPVVSTTLGTNGVHPLDMAQAYSVLANGGVLKRATFITKILGPTGKVIYDAARANPPVRVLDENVAWTETEMLKGPVRNGTASGELGNFPHPAAGKTGTTDKNVDAWFVGYTPQFTAAVWMGNPENELPMTNVGGITVFGGKTPARIWGAFMRPATQDLPALDFPAPNEALWPPRQFIGELGRRFGFSSGFSNPQNTTPGTEGSAPTTQSTPTTAPTSNNPKKPKKGPPPTQPSSGTTIPLGGP